MKSIFYEDFKNHFDENFMGMHKTIRDFNKWLKETNCPFSNGQLKKLEKKMKIDPTIVLDSNGTFGNKSVIYFDEKRNRFVGFTHAKIFNK